MSNTTFDEVLEAIEHLTPEAQLDLITVVERRLAERGRKRVIAEIAEGKAAFSRGEGTLTSVDELMNEIGE